MKAFALAALGALMALSSVLVRPGNASVEYVKICSLYGAGWFYYPGSDTCVNVFTGETRRQTSGGTYSALITRSPGQWVMRPELACLGRVQWIGTFNPADLTLNTVTAAYETRAVPFQLGSKEYVSSIMMKGGFGSPATGFCVSMKDTQGNSQVLGCADQSLLIGSPATWKFTPARSTPPLAFTAPYSFVGSNADKKWSGLPSSGSVTLSACIETAL